MDRLSDALGDQRYRDVAGGHDRVERVGRDPEFHDLLANRPARARGVGDENDGAATPPERHERVGGGPERFPAIVEHAPDVAKDRVVAIGDFAEARDGAGFGRGGNKRHARGLEPMPGTVKPTG
jgi:hypothetical protein